MHDGRVGTPRPGYYKERYATVLENGRCYVHPGEPALEGKQHCHLCKKYYRNRYEKAKQSGKCHAHPLVDAVAGARGCKKCLWRQITKATGWTPEQYEKAYRAQGGKCALCAKPGQMVASGAAKGECLVGDHCHKTGRTRGLLCTPCNMSLGFFSEDASRIERFAASVSSYLYSGDNY